MNVTKGKEYNQVITYNGQLLDQGHGCLEEGLESLSDTRHLDAYLGVSSPRDGLAN